MVKVKTVYGPHGWYVDVHVGERVTATYGPFNDAEREAFLAGAKAFAHPHIIQFPDGD